ncbi:MAG: carbon-nitrogen hydrolase family protein [Pelistega sp.]|nr:carbon-nitrogen hydrolase family protein [Pelistega sp.]
MATLKVGVGQFPASNDIEENKNYIRGLVEQAAEQKVKLFVLPEASMCSFASELEVLRQMASEHTPDFIQFMQSLATTHHMHIVVGVLSMSEEQTEPRVQNQLLAIDDSGEIITRYNKIHVYDAFKFKESDKVKPADLYEDGSMLGVFSIGEFTFGLINCYDLRFPELARALINRGVNVLSISANWIPGPYKEMHWELLLRARAVENTSYVLASGQTAPKGVGQSMIIDPMGFVLAGCGEQVGIQVQELDSARIDSVRELLPCLANRRLSL